jgi:DGQHR domain-containing protein
MSRREKLVVRAIRASQGTDADVFAFFLRGSDVTRVADISRISRDDSGLKGFQRKEIRNHVNSIVEFLDSGPVLFPNSIILALSPDVDFVSARGRKPENLVEVGDAGTLTIPILPEGRRSAWIVDGQQRSLALARAKNSGLAVPVVGFVSSDLEIQREQFILVNKAKPLPTRLINELLPEVSVLLPRDLAARQLPSALCDALATDPQSPFYKLVRRESNSGDGAGVVTDTALIESIRLSLKSPIGALAQYRRSGEGADTEAMYTTLVLYWKAVRDTFPEAWGKAATESRLSHSAGIRAVGALMDPIMLRADTTTEPAVVIREALARIEPHCAWTQGVWDGLGWKWNEVQSTSQHIAKLSEHLIRLDRELSRPAL